MKAGVAINPATPVAMLTDIICDVDLVCIMSVNPGYGGQSFIHNAVNKVKELKQLIIEKNSNAMIEVDGGINAQTGKLVAEAGADVLVAGSYVFGAENPVEAVESLYNL
jgi:ribulose-phosphate 3-epimerase